MRTETRHTGFLTTMMVASWLGVCALSGCDLFTGDIRCADESDCPTGQDCYVEEERCVDSCSNGDCITADGGTTDGGTTDAGGTVDAGGDGDGDAGIEDAGGDGDAGSVVDAGGGTPMDAGSIGPIDGGTVDPVDCGSTGPIILFEGLQDEAHGMVADEDHVFVLTRGVTDNSTLFKVSTCANTGDPTQLTIPFGKGRISQSDNYVTVSQNPEMGGSTGRVSLVAKASLEISFGPTSDITGFYSGESTPHSRGAGVNDDLLYYISSSTSLGLLNISGGANPPLVSLNGLSYGLFVDQNSVYYFQLQNGAVNGSSKTPWSLTR
jgi:hypothetical protein